MNILELNKDVFSIILQYLTSVDQFCLFTTCKYFEFIEYKINNRDYKSEEQIKFLKKYIGYKRSMRELIDQDEYNSMIKSYIPEAAPNTIEQKVYKEVLTAYDCSTLLNQLEQKNIDYQLQNIMKKIDIGEASFFETVKLMMSNINIPYQKEALEMLETNEMKEAIEKMFVSLKEQDQLNMKYDKDLPEDEELEPYDG